MASNEQMFLASESSVFLSGSMEADTVARSKTEQTAHKLGE